MIIKTGRGKRAPFRRLFRRRQQAPWLGVATVVSQQQFEAELAKETFRANRRQVDREFSLVSFDFVDRDPTDQQVFSLVRAFRDRIRLSDTIGWFELQLAVLLPETKKDGAGVVAADLLALVKQLDIEVKMTIAVYPWDDSLAAAAEELQQIAGGDQRDGGHCSGGHDAFQRFDSAHGSPFDAGCRGHASVDSSVGGVGALDSPTGVKPLTLADHQVEDDFLFCSKKTPLVKRAIDVAGAGVGVLMLSPLFIATAVAIKMNSAGPVFFIQQREGKDAKPFGIVKFRTMNMNAESQQAALRSQSEQDGPAFKLKDDPRITSVGKYLRKSCIDELPQLFNVIAGQMSLVGPRPLPVKESQKCVTWQRQRLSVLPGVTCIWQAHGGRDIKFSQWMRMDMEYIRKRNFFYDIKLIFETAFLAIMHKGSV